MRNSIQDFSLANPIYVGATVTAYTVDVNGVKTATKATLYANATGTTTLSNPQSLDSDGKFQQPVYIDDPVIMTVSGLSIADHDTGIVQSVLAAGQLSSVYEDLAADDGVLLVGNAADKRDLASTAAGKGSSLVGFPGGAGRTVEQQLDMLYYGIANILDPQYAGGAVAGTDCTAAIQAAMTDKLYVFVPFGEYWAANLVYRTGQHVFGAGHGAVIKLLANATLASHNGSVADSNGFYPANVFCSTLNHNGGIWNDSGTRATNEANSTYILENVTIENLTIDGNKSNNQIGDLGLNRSAMGAGVSINQCKNVTVQNCRIINCRLDGVFLGYSLHGGSDYCHVLNNHFDGNQRTNIALITGKYNTINGNTGTKPTGGTSVAAGAALDIEANLTGEVNYRHTISGNKLGGVLGIVAIAVAKQQDTSISGNVWVGGLAIMGANMTSGVIIANDVFIAQAATDDWITRQGPNVGSTTSSPTIIRNCTVSGFRRVMGALTTGQHENLSVTGCTFNVQSFGTLVRGYKIDFNDNTFYFSGNADAATLTFSNGIGGTVPNQGKIRFAGNLFNGVSQAAFILVSRDATWAYNVNDFVFDSGNEFRCTGSTQFMETDGSVTMDGNIIENFKPIKIGNLKLFRMVDNNVIAASAENMFSNQSGTFTDVDISSNDFVFVSVNLQRPKYATIVGNRMVDGAISITYSFTSAGIGMNHVAFNYMTAKAVIANPFAVITGGSYLSTDFVGNDQYKYNTNVGYTAGASITASIAGKYDGTFV